MDGGPAFHRLSEELLTLIADNFVSPNDSWADPHDLLSLRLIHPKFAYLSRILSRGFRELQFVASPRGVELPVEPYLDNISRYVEQVTFLPDAHSWLLGPKRFREIIITQAIHKYAVKNGCQRTLARQGGLGHPIEQWDEDPPLTDGDVEIGYAEYRRRAKHASQLLQTGRVQSAWVKALRCLPRAHTFKLGSREYPRSKSIAHHNNAQTILECQVSPWHFHDREHKSESCHDAMSPIGDFVTGIVAASLKAAGVRIEELIFKNVMTGLFQWRESPLLMALDLSNLRVLRWKPSFVPNIPDYLEKRVSDPLEDQNGVFVMARHNFEALEKLIDMSGGSLQVLDTGAGFPGIPMLWPPENISALPQIKELRVSGFIDPGEFAESLMLMPLLQDLTLSNCSRNEPFDSDVWVDVLQAIRKHPNRMRVRLHRLRLDHDDEFPPFQCHTGSQLARQPDDRDDARSALALYLSGQIEWNAVLSEHFE